MIGNPGDDVDVTFTINGTPLHPRPRRITECGGRSAGRWSEHHHARHQRRRRRPTSSCSPTATRRSVSRQSATRAAGEGTLHWFTITNTESTDVTVTWNGGSATVPAGQSTGRSARCLHLSCSQHNGQQIAQAAAPRRLRSHGRVHQGVGRARRQRARPTRSGSRDSWARPTSKRPRSPSAPESPVTIHLPSTMDPAGIDYKFEEIVQGHGQHDDCQPRSNQAVGPPRRDGQRRRHQRLCLGADRQGVVDADGDTGWTDHLHAAGHQHRWPDLEPSRDRRSPAGLGWNWSRPRWPVVPESVC